MADTCLIGLGAMGLGMARNILSSGIPLAGFDLNEAACAALREAGGEVPASAAEAAKGASLTVIMVVNAAQARTVLFTAGVAKAMAPGGTVMLCCTVAPAEARAISQELETMGLYMLDAPVSGGAVGAEAGTLTMMTSGPEAAYARAEPVLAACGGTIHRLGAEPGMGATYKVVHQLAAGVHIAAAAELMALGTKAGCDPAKLFEIVQGSAGASWMMGNRGPRMMQEDPEVTSSVDIFIKDLGLVLQTGRDAEAPLPLAAAALQMFTAARSLGHGSDDDALVIRAYEALTGEAAYKKVKG